jgi:hypothetical protein
MEKGLHLVHRWNVRGCGWSLWAHVGSWVRTDLRAIRHYCRGLVPSHRLAHSDSWTMRIHHESNRQDIRQTPRLCFR